MKAVTFSRFGTPDVLQLTEKPLPTCHEDQILIKIKSAGLNPIDYKTRNGSGFIAERLKDHLPSGLGYDFSGAGILVTVPSMTAEKVIAAAKQKNKLATS